MDQGLNDADWNERGGVMKAMYVAAIAWVLAACSQNSEPPEGADARTNPDNPAPSAEPTNAPGQPPEGASAQLAPTQGNETSGSLALAASAEGVRITGALQGLKPDSEFGFHIHENGDCSAPDASSAGEHFNPGNKQHGNPAGAEHHAGDMVNVRSDSQGVATIDTTAKQVTVHEGQATDVLGKAIVVHAKPDDYQTQPSGDSGDRIACGVITVEAHNVADATSG